MSLSWSASVAAKWPGKCPECGRTFPAGFELVLDLDTQRWVCRKHVALKVSERNKESDEYERSVATFRQYVIDACKCPVCAAPIGEPCRELGRVREEVHQRRVTRAHQTSVRLAPVAHSS